MLKAELKLIKRSLTKLLADSVAGSEGDIPQYPHFYLSVSCSIVVSEEKNMLTHVQSPLTKLSCLLARVFFSGRFLSVRGRAWGKW